MKRACARPRCPRFAAPGSGYCAAHRLSTSQRDYGPFHQHLRDQLARMLPAPCAYCGSLIHRGERFVAAHVIDGDPRSGRVPAHPTCNEQAKHRDLRPSLAHVVGAH